MTTQQIKEYHNRSTNKIEDSNGYMLYYFEDMNWWYVNDYIKINKCIATYNKMGNFIELMNIII
jgi:hypothetical protein